MYFPELAMEKESPESLAGFRFSSQSPGEYSDRKDEKRRADKSEQMAFTGQAQHQAGLSAQALLLHGAD